MPVQKQHWSQELGDFHWLCGRCQRGHLRRDHRAWVEELTADTVLGREHEDWDNEFERSRFAGLLRCDSPTCRDPVSVTGTLRSEGRKVGCDEYETVTTYWVTTVSPPPLPYPISDSVPSAIGSRLRSAAGLLWSDHDAAANKIRQAVEALLDERRVKKYPRNGPRKPIPLHARITDFSAKYKSAAQHLLAIKWIGNAGSHDGGLSRSDVLDALDLMEEVLEEVYVRHRLAVLRKAVSINKRKRPLGKSNKA
jgi:hypothetical protein